MSAKSYSAKQFSRFSNMVDNKTDEKIMETLQQIKKTIEKQFYFSFCDTEINYLYYPLD